MSFRRPPRRHTLLAALAVVALTAAGCGGGDDGDSTPPEPGRVVARDNYFEHKTTTIAVGDTVTWTFRGAVAHNVAGPGFTSDTVKSGTFEHTFEKAGTVEYVCTIHAGMTGKVVVE